MNRNSLRADARFDYIWSMYQPLSRLLEASTIAMS